MPAINTYRALESAKAHLNLQRELAIILKNDPVPYLKKSGIILANFIQYLKDHIAHYGTPVCSLEQLDRLKGPFSASADTKDYITFLSNLKNSTVNTVSLDCPTDITSIDAHLANITIELKHKPIVSIPTPFNNTISDDNSNEAIVTGNPHFSFPAKLGTAFGLGLGIGLLDSASQVVLHIAERYGCSPRTLGLLTITLALATTVGVSALPLIYSIVTTLDNDQIDPHANSENVLNLTYVFMATLALHILKNMPRHLERLDDFLNKRTLLKQLLRNLPLLGCLFITVYGNASFLESLSIAVVTLLGAAIPSNATQKILSCFPIPSKMVGNANALTDGIEMNIITDPKVHLEGVKRQIAASQPQVAIASTSNSSALPGHPIAKEYSSMFFKPAATSSNTIPNQCAAIHRI